MIFGKNLIPWTLIKCWAPSPSSGLVPGLLPCCWHSPKLSQPKTVPSPGGASGTGTQPKERAKPNPTLQTDFAPDTYSLSRGCGNTCPGFGAPKLVPGGGIPGHVQPGSSEQGHATGEPSQLQALEKLNTLPVFTQHFGQSVLSFCCVQDCIKCSLQAARCPTESLRGKEGNIKRGN